MPENFRLSVFNKRQSYDLTQANLSAGVDLTRPIGHKVTEGEEICITDSQLQSQRHQQQIRANTSESAKTRYLIQKHGNPQRDYWLCIGMLFIVLLFFLGGILILNFNYPPKDRRDNMNETTT